MVVAATRSVPHDFYEKRVDIAHWGNRRAINMRIETTATKVISFRGLGKNLTHSWTPTPARVARLARRWAEWPPLNMKDVQDHLGAAAKQEMHIDIRKGESQSHAGQGNAGASATSSGRAAALRARIQQWTARAQRLCRRGNTTAPRPLAREPQDP